MHLSNQHHYKIIIADEPEEVIRATAGHSPASSNSDSGDDVSDSELGPSLSDFYNYLEPDSSDESLIPDTESESDDDDIYNWSPPPSPLPLAFELDDGIFDDEPIDEDELEELLAVLENIVRSNPDLLDDPRPVIDLDIFKYGSFVAGTEELVWEFEYCIHEYPTHTFSVG